MTPPVHDLHAQVTLKPGSLEVRGQDPDRQDFQYSVGEMLCVGAID